MEIIDFIVCDDIRQEIGNKMTLVGVYGDNINLDSPSPSEIKWPIPMKLGFMLRLRVPGDESKNLNGSGFELEILLNGAPLCHFNGQMLHVDANSKLSSIAVVSPLLPLPQPGILTFKFRVKRGATVIFEENPRFELAIRVRQSMTIN